MRYCAILLTLVLVVTLAGCWDQVELEELGLVMLMGIDMDPLGDGFEVTVHLLRPQGNTEQTGTHASTVVMSGRGQTIIDAARNMRGRIPAQISFHHVRIIVLGEDLARKGIAPVLDFIVRTPEIRLGSYILVAQGTARDILTTTPEMAQSLHGELEGLITAQGEWSKGFTPRIFEFLKSYIDPASHATTARVFITIPEVPPASQEEVQGEGDSGGQQEGQEVVLLQGLAVFRDDQLVGWMTGTETIGLRFITGQGEEMVMVVPWRAALVSVEINLTFSELEYIKGSDPPRFRQKVQTNARIMEYTGYTEFSAARLMQLQALVAETLRDLLKNAEQRAKALDTDVLGYGSTISRQDPRTWDKIKKNWRETFPTSSTDYEIFVNLVHTNMLRGPLPPRPEDD